MLSWSMWANITQGNYQCNVASIKLGQNLGISHNQCCPNTSEITSHKKITYATLALSSQTYFCGKRTYILLSWSAKQLPAQCSVGPQSTVKSMLSKYSWGNIAQDSYWPKPHSHLFAGKITIRNVVLICLSQHCTSKLPVQCWPSLETTLDRQITCAMLTQSRNNFGQKNILHFFWIYLGQHYIRKLFVGCSPMAPLWENNLYNIVSTMRARLHETRSELKPVWNLKPPWNLVPFTWQFT